MVASVFGFGRSSGGAIRSYLILFLLSATATAKPAAPTGTGTNNIDKWAHLQTSHRPTEAPRLHYENDLRRRELSIVSYATTPPGSNTCGFFTEDGSPMWCDAGYSCANIGNIRDCCAGGDCKTSSFSSVCLDYTDPACSTYSPGTKCCGGDDPQAAYCGTWIWGTSTAPKQLFTLFDCVEKQYAGNFSLWAEEPIFVSDASVTPSSHPPLPIPTSNPGEAGPAPQSNANSGPNIGAIVGGVIGGVALIGILLLIFYYLRNRGRRQLAQQQHGGGEPQGGQDGYRPAGNGPPMAYNSPPPPSESYWSAPDGTVSSASPAMTGGTASLLTAEQQPLVAGHLIQQQQWQQQQQQMQQQQWQQAQNPQQFQNQLQQEEADRGMAVGMAMGMNAMKQKSPIEMSNSPTSYEVSTASLYQELAGNSPPRPNAELPG